MHYLPKLFPFSIAYGSSLYVRDFQQKSAVHLLIERGYEYMSCLLLPNDEDNREEPILKLVIQPSD